MACQPLLCVHQHLCDAGVEQALLGGPNVVFPVLEWLWGVSGERVDIMTGSGGKVLSAYVEEVSPMRTHLRDDSWRPYVIPNKVRFAGAFSLVCCLA